MVDKNAVEIQHLGEATSKERRYRWLGPLPQPPLLSRDLPAPSSCTSWLPAPVPNLPVWTQAGLSIPTGYLPQFSRRVQRSTLPVMRWHLAVTLPKLTQTRNGPRHSFIQRQIRGEKYPLSLSSVVVHLRFVQHLQFFLQREYMVASRLQARGCAHFGSPAASLGASAVAVSLRKGLYICRMRAISFSGGCCHWYQLYQGSSPSRARGGVLPTAAWEPQ